jgi:hypothetical protein
MKTLLSIALASLLALAAPVTAEGATKFRTYRTQMVVSPMQPGGGSLELRVKFQNSKKHRKRFNPRVVTSIDLAGVPLTCFNAGPPGPVTGYSLTTTVPGPIPVNAVRPPHASKPKKGRYAYRFSLSFEGFAGSFTATIDKPNVRKRGTPPRVHGMFTITDLDADATHSNCATSGGRGFSMPRPEA